MQWSAPGGVAGHSGGSSGSTSTLTVVAYVYSQFHPRGCRTLYAPERFLTVEIRAAPQRVRVQPTRSPIRCTATLTTTPGLSIGLGRQPLRRTQFVRILPRCWLDTPRPRIRVLHQTRLVHHAPDLTAYPDSDGVPSSEAEDLATSIGRPWAVRQQLRPCHDGSAMRLENRIATCARNRPSMSHVTWLWHCLPRTEFAGTCRSVRLTV